MALTTCTVRCALSDQNGQPLAGAVITATLNRYEVYQGHVVPRATTAVTAADGTAQLVLWPNALGAVESAYEIAIQPSGGTVYRTTAVVPNLASTDLHLISELSPYPGMTNGQLLIDTAADTVTVVLAAKDTAVASANDAGMSATNAAASASSASTSASSAATSAVAAATSESNAAASASNAATSESNAATSATAAANSATAAATSATNASDTVAALAAAGGSTLVGHGSETVKAALDARLPEIGTYALLRAYTGPLTAFHVICREQIFDGAHGDFRVIVGDTTSLDTDGTILVDALGRRWRREHDEDINLKWFVGASADATAGLAAAHTYAAGLANGATLYIPRGVFDVSAFPDLAPNVNWRGDGRLASILRYAGTGDGLKFAGMVNTYTSLRISLRDFGLVCSNAGNTGGGIVLESCAYVWLRNVYFEKFKYGLILDQVTHFGCIYSEFTQQSRACVWVVNGDDRRATANQGWTNNLWFGPEIQINQATTAGIYGIQDDGGVNHQYNGVNFNGGNILARFAGVKGLGVINCAFEGSSTTPFALTDTSRENATYVGPCRGFSIRESGVASGTAYQIDINAADTGVIEANGFANMSSAAFTFTSEKVANVTIRQNRKLINGGSRNAKPFFDSSLTTSLLRSVDTSGQPGQSYVAAAHAGGVQVVTPATMERLRVGDYVYCVNEDGTNGETVLITATGATTFTATFAMVKAANWLVYGQTAQETDGTWAPTIVGTSTAGANTYTAQVGHWRRVGNQVHVTGTITMTAKDATMAGNIEIGGLPFRCVNTSNRNNIATFGYYSGLTFPANFTQLAGLVTPNSSQIALRRNGSGQTGAGVAVPELGASSTLIFEATYYTH